MTWYRVLNTASGADLGAYEAGSPEDAVLEMLADAGGNYYEVDPDLSAVEVAPPAEVDDETAGRPYTLLE